MVVSCCYYGHGRGEDTENFVPVVTRYPDRLTRLDRRSPSTCKDKENFGRGPWHGQETVPQHVAQSGDRPTSPLITPRPPATPLSHCAAHSALPQAVRPVLGPGDLP